MSNLVEMMKVFAEGPPEWQKRTRVRPLTTATDDQLADAEAELEDEYNGWKAAADDARAQMVHAEMQQERYDNLLFRVRREQQIRERKQQ